MFQRLREAADARGLVLRPQAVEHARGRELAHASSSATPTMYLSGRPLHAVTTNLAAGHRRGVRRRPAALVRRRRRLLQRGRPARVRACARSRSAPTSSRRAATCGCSSTRRRWTPRSMRSARSTPPTSSAGRRSGRRLRGRRQRPSRRARASTCAGYADQVRRDWRYRKDSFRTDRSKTPRAPRALRLHRGALSRRVPGRPAGARATWPPCAPATSPRPSASPAWTTRCRRSSAASATTCARTPASARISTSRWRSGRSSASSWSRRQGRRSRRRAAGRSRRRTAASRSSGPGRPASRPPSGSARAGIGVTIFEAHPYAGGMVGGAIPAYRLPQAQIDQDLAVLERLGVEIRYGAARRRRRHARRPARATGSPRSSSRSAPSAAKRLGPARARMPPGVIDGVDVPAQRPRGPADRRSGRGSASSVPATPPWTAPGPRAASAPRPSRSSTAARSTRCRPTRRRSTRIREEGIEIVELARPVGLRVEDGRLAGARRAPGPSTAATRDASGRKVPDDVPGSDVRDRPGHPDPRDQPARRCSTSSATGRRT